MQMHFKAIIAVCCENHRTTTIHFVGKTRYFNIKAADTIIGVKTVLIVKNNNNNNLSVEGQFSRI